MKEAIAAYDRAIAEDITGDRVRYLFNRGTAHRLSGNNVLALQDYLNAFKTDNVFKQAAEVLDRISAEYVKKGLHALKNKNNDSAIQNFQMAFLDNRNSTDAKKGLDHFKINPSSIMAEKPLLQLGFNDPSVILGDFGA